MTVGAVFKAKKKKKNLREWANQLQQNNFSKIGTVEQHHCYHSYKENVIIDDRVPPHLCTIQSSMPEDSYS